MTDNDRERTSHRRKEWAYLVIAVATIPGLAYFDGALPILTLIIIAIASVVASKRHGSKYKEAKEA